MSRFYTQPQEHLKSVVEKTNKVPEKIEKDWIYPGDLCWFLQPEKVHLVEEKTGKNWKYANRLLRIINPEDPIQYVKLVQEKNAKNGKTRSLHYIECLGFSYVFRGHIYAFTKDLPEERGIQRGHYHR